MICPNCGTNLRDGTAFCVKCGARLNPAPQPMPAAQQYAQPAPASQQYAQPAPAAQQYAPPASAAQPYAQNYRVPGMPPLIGFSPRVNDPAVLAALQKNNKAAAGFAAVFIPLPFIGFIIASFFSEDMSFGNGVLYGAIVSVIFLLCYVISAAAKKTSKSWDGVVTEKFISHRDRSEDRERLYILKLRTDDGKTKKIEEKDISRRYFDYLEIGDRVRFHPQFTYYYEKYDKSRDGFVYCPICATKCGVELDFCPKCKTPVIK